MSYIWEKYYCVVVNDILQSATLHEFEMNDYDVNLIKSDFIYKDEYPEYISDSNNWIPLKKFITDMGRLEHWSGMQTIRKIEKIKEDLMIIDNEEIAWIYRSIE
jgi:hypothetical protein